ncbi:MAG: hypothetical protein LIO58_07835 [Oscillospiraceae bacterium]|nr:hypothetical protein [Oscillospiraceae bacterium]
MEQNDQRPQGTEQEEETLPYTPASPAKRVLAWMGVVYMVIIVLLTTYNLATGEPLHGIPAVFLFPACGAFAVISFLRYRDDKRKPFFLLLAIAAGALCVLTVVVAIGSLIVALGA